VCGWNGSGSDIGARGNGVHREINMNQQVIETDERDLLSACHRDYMVRYVEFELQRQQSVSERFLREKGISRAEAR
jgi:hypothetical protein